MRTPLGFCSLLSSPGSYTELPLLTAGMVVPHMPHICQVAEGPGGQTMGYILGKVEGKGELWHGHVTAVTVRLCTCPGAVCHCWLLAAVLKA
jgi:hypothetical protein